MLHQVHMGKSFTLPILGFVFFISGCCGDLAQAQMQMKAQTITAQTGKGTQQGAAVAPVGQTPFPKLNPVPNMGSGGGPAPRSQQEMNTILNDFAKVPPSQVMPNQISPDLLNLFPGLGQQSGGPFPRTGRSSDGNIFYPGRSSDDGNVGFSDSDSVGGTYSRCNPPVKTSYEKEFSKIKMDPSDINKISGAQCNMVNGQPPTTDPLVCMACNLYFEVDPKDSLEGHIAVARSVMTRAMSQGYPETVCKVVYQHNGQVAQYSWTFERPYWNPNHVLPRDIGQERMKTIFAAAKEAFEKGPNGYTNYFAQNLMKPGKPKWKYDGSCNGTLCTIQHHTFCSINAKQNRSFDSYYEKEGRQVAALDGKTSPGPAAPNSSSR